MSIKIYREDKETWEKVAGILATSIQLIDSGGNYAEKDLESVLKEVAEGMNNKFDKVQLGANGNLNFYCGDILKQSVVFPTSYGGGVSQEIINQINNEINNLKRLKYDNVEVEESETGSRINFYANGIKRKSIEVVGGGGVASPKISSDYNKKIVPTDYEIEIPYHVTSPKNGEHTAIYSVDGKVTTLPIALGANVWKIGKLVKGEHRLKVYVMDRDGVVSNELTFVINVGALAISTNFLEDKDYEISENIQLDYTVEYPTDDVIQVSLILDGKETIVQNKRGGYAWKIGILEKGVHRVKMIAYDGENYSNELNITIMVVDSSSVYVSTPFETIAQDPDYALTVQFRVSSQLNTKFDAECYINGNLNTRLTAVLGNNFWSIGYLETGTYELEIRVTEPRTGTVGNIVRIQVEVATTDFVPIQPVGGSLIAHFSSKGKSNNSVDREEWKDKSGNNVKATLHNVNFNNNGWIQDKLELNGDAYVEIDLRPFAGDAEGGLTIDILYEFENSGDINARVFSCEETTNPYKGLYIDTKTFSLKSSGELNYTPTREKSLTRSTMVINRKLGHSYLFTNGVVCSNVILTTIDKFAHDSKIFLGARKDEEGEMQNFGICTIREVRVYSRVLTHTEVLQNYMSDLTIPEQKVLVAKNENISMPEMHFDGNFDGMGADDQVPLKLTYYAKESGTTSFETNALVDWQGNSSLQYRVKNYNIDLLTPDNQEYNIQIRPDWVKHDSYHIKANMVDSSHAYNLGVAKMVAKIYTSKLPPMATNPLARYAVDGFPILAYHNGAFYGVYTFNLKQHRKVFGLSKDESDHWMYRAEENSANGSASFRAWSDKDIESEWEERHPKRDMNDWEQFPDGDPNYPPYNPDDLNSGKHAEFRKMIKWVYDADDETFKREFADHFNLEFTLDYYICCYVFGMVDSLGKNMTMTSWGKNSKGHQVWYPMMYDMD